MNALAAFSDTYNVLEGMAQDRAKRQAGNALAQGDYQGASGALLGRGMLDEGMGVQRYQQGQEDRSREQQQQLSEQEKAAAGERVGFLMRATQTLRGLPAEQRAQVLQSQILPAMANLPGFDPELLSQVAQTDLSDQTLDTFSQSLGAEAEKWQLFNLGDGGIAGVNPRTMETRTLREPTVDPLEQEYMRARIDATKAQVPLREAQAQRAARPPAARGGGGGGSAGKPWERSW